jgi:hypothetical protein
MALGLYQSSRRRSGGTVSGKRHEVPTIRGGPCSGPTPTRGAPRAHRKPTLLRTSTHLCWASYSNATSRSRRGKDQISFTINWADSLPLQLPPPYWADPLPPQLPPPYTTLSPLIQVHSETLPLISSRPKCERPAGKEPTEQVPALDPRTLREFTPDQQSSLDGTASPHGNLCPAGPPAANRHAPTVGRRPPRHAQYLSACSASTQLTG